MNIDRKRRSIIAVKRRKEKNNFFRQRFLYPHNVFLVMRVGIIADTVYGYISGVAVFTQRLIDKLLSSGDEVVVFTSGRKTEVKVEGKKKIYFFPGLGSKKFTELSIAMYPLHKIGGIIKKEQLDIIHIQLTSPLCAVALFSAKIKKIPIVVTSHTQPGNVFDNVNIHSKKIRAAFYRYITWLYSFADYIVCPSEHAKKELIRYHIKKSVPISVISNGIDTTKFKPSKSRKKRVLFVGRLMKEKCIPTLIKASAIVKNTHPEYEFVIVGSGFLEEDLKMLAHKLSSNIKFTGRVSDKELVEYYQTSSILVLPSSSELQGLVLLEAMACGGVTIASDSKQSAAKDLANFTFPHNDYVRLAERINSLIEDERLVKELSLKNREYICSEHNESTIIDKYKQVYIKAIENKKKKLNKKLVQEI